MHPSTLLLLLPLGALACRPANRDLIDSLPGIWSLISTGPHSATEAPLPITKLPSGLLQVGKSPESAYMNVTSEANRLIDATAESTVAFRDLNSGAVWMKNQNQGIITTFQRLAIQNRVDCVGGLGARALIVKNGTMGMPPKEEDAKFCAGAKGELLMGEKCTGSTEEVRLFFVEAMEGGGVRPGHLPPPPIV